MKQGMAKFSICVLDGVYIRKKPMYIELNDSVTFFRVLELMMEVYKQKDYYVYTRMGVFGTTLCEHHN